MGVWWLFRDFAYAIILFAFWEEGGPGYLANFLQTNPKNSDLALVDGFHMVLEAFSVFAYGTVFLHFWMGGAAGYLANPPRKFWKKQSELGTWISKGFGCFFP